MRNALTLLLVIVLVLRSRSATSISEQEHERSTSTNAACRIDMHVHMVGNGVAGSGGWLRLNGWHRWLAGFMVKQLGFPAAVLDQDLESVYARASAGWRARVVARRDCAARARAGL